MRRAPAFALALMLAACGGNDVPGAASPSEADALNEAAAALEANSVDANAVILELDEREAAE